MKRANNGREEVTSVVPEKRSSEKRGESSDSFERTATRGAQNTSATISVSTSTSTTNTNPQTKATLDCSTPVQPAIQDAPSSITNLHGSADSGNDHHHLSNTLHRHQPALERLAVATKLCADLTTWSNTEIENPNVFVPIHHDAGRETSSSRLSRSELLERLRLGQTQRGIVRLRVFVNALVESTLSGPDDNSTNLSNMRSAVRYIFRLLASISHRPSGNFSQLPLDMRQLLDVGLRRIFVLAESHPAVPAAILQNVDILVLDDGGRDALRHLASCNPRFAVRLQLHLIESMVDAGNEIQQKSAVAAAAATNDEDDVMDKDGSLMNSLWTHRHRYQSCAVLLLTSTVINRRCGLTSKAGNDRPSITNKGTSNNIQPIEDSSSSDEHNQSADRGRESSPVKFCSSSPELNFKDQTVQNRSNEYLSAIGRLQRLQLDPELFPSLVVVKDKIIEHVSDSKESVV